MTPTTIFATRAGTTTPTTPRTRSRAGRSGRSATTTRAVKVPADASRTVALLSTRLNEASSVVVFMAATAMPAMADEAVSASASAEISPFAGVVDVSVLALLAYFAKLGNEKAAREAQSKTKTSRSKRK